MSVSMFTVSYKEMWFGVIWCEWFFILPSLESYDWCIGAGFCGGDGFWVGSSDCCPTSFTWSPFPIHSNLGAFYYFTFCEGARVGCTHKLCFIFYWPFLFSLLFHEEELLGCYVGFLMVQDKRQSYCHTAPDTWHACQAKVSKNKAVWINLSPFLAARTNILSLISCLNSCFIFNATKMKI